ncbi:MAG: hypothetical protein MUE44_05015 [Oscillatoriaceae cyanobacterium Prado104]|jgi:hypothetical protein|nr:hypothetical protein [Oscillatoriaceae cyanobacterium Prado104]
MVIKQAIAIVKFEGSRVENNMNINQLIDRGISYYTEGKNYLFRAC